MPTLNVFATVDGDPFTLIGTITLTNGRLVIDPEDNRTLQEITHEPIELADGRVFPTNIEAFFKALPIQYRGVGLRCVLKEEKGSRKRRVRP